MGGANPDLLRGVFLHSITRTFLRDIVGFAIVSVTFALDKDVGAQYSSRSAIKPNGLRGKVNCRMPSHMLSTTTSRELGSLRLSIKLFVGPSDRY